MIFSTEICQPRTKAAALAIFVFMAVVALCPVVVARTIHEIPNIYQAGNVTYVSDPDAILSDHDKAAINAQAKELEQATGVEVAVVVVRDTAGEDARVFANELFNLWGIGKKDKDNGLLILLVTEPPERSVVFETGYGLEGDLPDALCYSLQQDYMVPYFASGAYGPGLLAGIRAVGATLAGTGEPFQVAEMQRQAQPSSLSPGIVAALAVCAAIAVIFGAIFIMYKVLTRICPKCGKKSLIISRNYSRVQDGQTLYYRYGKCVQCDHVLEESNVPKNKVDEIFGCNGHGGSSRSGGRIGGRSGSSRSSSRSSSSRGGGRSGGGGSHSRF